MVQGVKFNPSDSSDVRSIAKRYNGNVQAIARYYNVHKETIYDYFKRHPEGMKIIQECREVNHDEFLDEAEFVYKYAIANYKNNLGFAMRAADKIIDKKGHSRGWTDKELDAQATQESMDKFIDMMDRLEKRQSSLNKAETSNINESKS